MNIVEASQNCQSSAAVVRLKAPPTVRAQLSVKNRLRPSRSESTPIKRMAGIAMIPLAAAVPAIAPGEKCNACIERDVPRRLK